MRKVLNKPRSTAILVGLGVVLLLTTLLASPWLWRTSRAEIIYVRPTATGAGNGTSWDNATTLRDALQHRAGRGDEVWIAAGTHYPVVPNNLAAVTDAERKRSFVVRSGVALYGGFAGTETARDQRDPATHTTVLSGNIDQDSELNAGNSWIVVNLSGTDATTILDGLTITGGSTDTKDYNREDRQRNPFAFPFLPYWGQPYHINMGGEIFMVGGSPTLTNVHIIGSRGDIRGGTVVYVASGQLPGATASRPTFIDVTISDNASSGDGVVRIAGTSEVTFRGGTISNNGFTSVNISDDSTVSFTDMTISDNGSGILIWGNSTVSFSNMTMNGMRGVGVSIARESSATFTDVILSDNGISVEIDDQSSATFTDVILSDNEGGVFIWGQGSATFSNVTLSDNGEGVGIRDTASLTFTDVTISDNGRGMTIWNTASLTLTDVTISDNGVDVSGGDESSVTCTNMTLRDNVTYEGPQPPTICTSERPR